MFVSFNLLENDLIVFLYVYTYFSVYVNVRVCKCIYVFFFGGGGVVGEVIIIIIIIVIIERKEEKFRLQIMLWIPRSWNIFILISIAGLIIGFNLGE